MTLVQKITLTIISVLFFIGAFISLVVRAEADKDDKTQFNKDVRRLAKVILLFGLSMTAFVIELIWKI